MRRRLPDVDTLGEIDVLSTDECADLARSVLDAREHWTVRSPTGRFATLGANSYMDLAPSEDVETTYFARAARANRLLIERFGGVYARLATVVGAELGLATRYGDDLALPGFHIWIGSAIPRAAVASIHFDLQYQRLLERTAYVGATGALSFTLPVAIPPSGASLHVWPRYEYPDRTPVTTSVPCGPPTVVPYDVGRALLHTGHVLHQVGASPDATVDDVRIMLQGHGLVVDDTLILYW